MPSVNASARVDDVGGTCGTAGNPLLIGDPLAAGSGIRAEASPSRLPTEALQLPTALSHEAAEPVAVGVLQGVALTMLIDIGQVRPLQGEPTMPSRTGAEVSVAAHSLRSNIDGAACANQNPDLVESGILVDAGATVGATSWHGFVLTIPVGPLLARHGERGDGVQSSWTLSTMEAETTIPAASPSATPAPKSKHKSCMVTTSRKVLPLSSFGARSMDSGIFAYASQPLLLRRFERRVRFLPLNAGGVTSICLGVH